MNIWVAIFLFLHVMGAIVAFGPSFSAFPVIGPMAGKEPQHANFAARVSEQITKTRVVPLAIFQGITGLVLIYSRVTLVLGGVLLPIDLFPESVQGVLAALPFASVVYGPARMFVDPDAATLAGLLGRQAVAIGVYAAVAAGVYAAAVRRIHAHGG